MKSYFREQNIAKLNLLSLLIVIILLSVCLGYLFMSEYQSDFKEQLRKIEENYVYLYKEKIKSLVDFKIQSFDIQNNRMSYLLEQELKKRIYTIYRTVRIIYNTYDTVIPLQETKEIIKSSIKSIHWQYKYDIYLISPDGDYMAFGKNQDFLKTIKLIDFPEVRGDKLIKKIVKRVSSHDELFLKYQLSHQNSVKQNSNEGLLFVKRLDAYGWVIASQDSFVGMTTQLRKEALLNINSFSDQTITQGSDFEVFYVNKNNQWISDLEMITTNKNGSLLFQKITTQSRDQKNTPFGKKILKEINQSGSAYSLIWDQTRDGKPKAKLIYFKYYPKWNWVISKGFDLDDINNEEINIQTETIRLQQNMWKKIRSALALFILFIILAVLISIWFSKGIAGIFNEYKETVEERNKELADKNTLLEKEISERKHMETSLIRNREKLRRLAAEVQLAEEREKRTIASDLHDSIGATLSVSNLKLELLANSIKSKKTIEELNVIHQNIKQVIQQTRSLTFQLSPPVLYAVGLEAALSGLAEQTEKIHQIKTVFEDDQLEKSLDEDTRIHIFRSVRELIVNIIKYAQAKNITISVARIEDQIHVKVIDDGIGFNVTDETYTPGNEGGFGLFSIKERLDLFGGHLKIQSELGVGTNIIMKAPLLHCEIKISTTEIG
jgi:signal transduction histidine kinase